MCELVEQNVLDDEASRSLAARTSAAQIDRIRTKLHALRSGDDSIHDKFDALERDIDALYESFRDKLEERHKALQQKIDKCWPKQSYTGKPWPRDGDGKPMELK
jgi:hypothetical protein